MKDVIVKHIRSTLEAKKLRKSVKYEEKVQNMKDKDAMMQFNALDDKCIGQQIIDY